MSGNKFQIKPVAHLGPYRRWVVYPPYRYMYWGVAYAATLPDAFEIVRRVVRDTRRSYKREEQAI